MQHQNAAIYVCKEANCQLKTDTEGHRGLCRYQDVMMACCHIVTVIFFFVCRPKNDQLIPQLKGRNAYFAH